MCLILLEEYYEYVFYNKIMRSVGYYIEYKFRIYRDEKDIYIKIFY